MATTYGTDKPEYIRSYADNDTIYGFAGKDDLGDYLFDITNASNDHYYGGRGNDRLLTVSGDDKLAGGAGDDYIMSFGGPGSITVRGGCGDDQFDIKARETDFTIIEEDGGRIVYQRDDQTDLDYTITVYNVEDINFLL